MKRGLKILIWIVMGTLLLIIGVLVGAVRVLSPERLTPLAVRVANEALNADVSISRVELSLRQSFPFLNIDIDSMVIRSRDIGRLPLAARDTLPVWADTLASIESLHGGINVFKAVAGVIDLKDLKIAKPRVNILIVNDSLNNFSITLPSTEPEDTAKSAMPDIRLNHFSLIDPEPLKYADLAQHTFMSATIKSAELTDSHERSRDYVPLYRIDFDSNVTSPLLAIIGQESFPITFDGIVEWNHLRPYQIALKDFDFGVSQLSGRINVEADFNDGLTINDCDFRINPISVTDFLAMVPDSIAREYYIPKAARTDANVNFEGRLSKPYVVGSASMPYAQLSLSVPTCSLRYDKINLSRFELMTQVDVHGGSPNDARLLIDKFFIEGPGTSLQVRGTLTDVLSDPLFDGEIDGVADLEQLPSYVLRHLGATLKGHVTAHTSLIGRPSMFSRDYFHQLRLAGDINVDKFMYLADDTLSMYAINRADMHFGTHERVDHGRGVLADSLLSAKLKADTANILVSGLDIKVGKLALGVGAQNKDENTDTTLVIPMGGGLSVGTMSLFSITDSAGLRVKGIKGRVSMKRYRDDAHLPLFTLNLGLDRLSTGNNHTRFMVSKGDLRCSLAKLPDDQLSTSRREIRHLADSLHRCHPNLPIDSVYVKAAEIRRRNSRPGHHRVHPELTAQDNEIIEWGTTSAMRRLLLDWRVEGSLTADGARLFTASLPVRNMVQNLNLTFNNDSIALTDVKYKAGNSDFLISGNVTNIKKAFTSRRTPSALRVNFSVLSDYIDVNELSHALFTGSANKDAKIDDATLDESRLDRELEQHERTDSVAPLLIPTNIDAQLDVNARSVAYADFVLHDFKGKVLMYDGALNLHDLRASSEVGSIDLTALYSAPSPQRIDFGFGMKLDDFNISNFIKLVPAVDSIMPMIHDLSGIINANLALTSEINSNMDLVLPSVKAAINLNGDSLSFVDEETFHKVAKWLLFKDKERNMIDHVSAQMIVEDGQMRVFPFIFDIDRYKLGVQGYNDFNMNFNYHIAVLESPIPFRFGINIKGDYGKLKIRFGGPKFNEKTTVDRSPIVNDTRINLINQFQNVFRRGVRNSKFATVDISEKPLAQEIDLEADTLSVADSLYYQQQGMIPK